MNIENPAVPIDRIVADLNMDMIGRNWKDTIVAIGKEHSDLGATLKNAALKRPRAAWASNLNPGVMVVDRLAFDIGVLAIGQVHSFDRAELGEQLEGPEDRRPADIEPAFAGVVDQIRELHHREPNGRRAAAEVSNRPTT